MFYQNDPQFWIIILLDIDEIHLNIITGSVLFVVFISIKFYNNTPLFAFNSINLLNTMNNMQQNLNKYIKKLINYMN